MPTKTESESNQPVVDRIADRLKEVYGKDIARLCKELGWSESRVKTLIKKRSTGPWALLADCPRLAVLTGIRRDTLLKSMIAEFTPTHALIGRKLAFVQGSRGIQTDELAREIGISGETLLMLYGGRLDKPQKNDFDMVSKFLDVSADEMERLIAQGRAKRRFPTSEYGDIPDAPCIAELLFEAHRREGINPNIFAEKYHFGQGTIRALLEGQQPDITSDFLNRLAKTLKIDEARVGIGFKRNQPLPDGPHPVLHQRLEEKLAKSKGNMRAKAKEIGIARSTLERLLLLPDFKQANLITMHTVRCWLGLSWPEFVALAAAKGNRTGLKTIARRSLTSALPEEDDEILLLRHWRKAKPPVRVAALNLLMGVEV